MSTAFFWKIPGIILYVDPLPSPLSTKSTTKTLTKSGSDFSMLANTRIPVAAAMATKFQSVILAPP